MIFFSKDICNGPVRPIAFDGGQEGENGKRKAKTPFYTRSSAPTVSVCIPSRFVPRTCFPPRSRAARTIRVRTYRCTRVTIDVPSALPCIFFHVRRVSGNPPKRRRRANGNARTSVETRTGGVASHTHTFPRVLSDRRRGTRKRLEFNRPRRC